LIGLESILHAQRCNIAELHGVKSLACGRITLGNSPYELIVIPAKAGIQYAEVSPFLLAESGGILDHPLSRMMTAGGAWVDWPEA